jgi:hypothetical protein
MQDIKLDQITGDIQFTTDRETVIQDVRTIMTSSNGMLAVSPYIGLGITDSISSPNIRDTKARLIKQAEDQNIVIGEVDYDFVTGDYNVEILSD